MGRAGMREALTAGANDLGGTLMNESITRAAGATHGQEMTQSDMLSLAASVRRRAVQRTTLYRRPEGVAAPHEPHDKPLCSTLTPAE
jgi:FO synthase